MGTLSELNWYRVSTAFRIKRLLDTPILIIYSKETSGGVAQLARAFEWHSRGQGFNSPHLHGNLSLVKNLHTTEKS